MQNRTAAIRRSRCIARDQMPSHKRAPELDGKPTIELENHDQNVGQRESSHAGGKGGKPTISPETHDANYGQRDTIDEEDDELLVDVDEDVDIEESRSPRRTGEDVEESRGSRSESDVESSRGGRNGDDVEPYLGETRVISDDSEVE